jgi:hypothetical protein
VGTVIIRRNQESNTGESAPMKTSKDLSNHIREKRTRGDTTEINVIITLTKTIEHARLESMGLKVTNMSQAGQWVAGSITADKLEKLLKFQEVEHADLDGETRAL